jgi:hypothetical protein
MPEAADHRHARLPEDDMLARLAASEQMREFFIQMWLQNPALAEKVGSRMQQILSPAPPGCRS